jgi:site-specific recombinase XerD
MATLVVSGPELWDHYYEHLLARRRRPRTIRLYRYNLYAFWGFTGKMLQANLVTKKDAERFLSRTTVGPNSSGERVQANTAASEGHILKAAYRWWAEEGLIGRVSPLARLVVPSGVTGPPRDLDLEAVGRLLKVAEATDERMATILWLAFGCGLRAGEIAAARLEHVYPAMGTRPMTIEVEGKGGKRRVVPVQGAAAEWLSAYLKTRPRTGELVAREREHGHGNLQAQRISRLAGNFMHANGFEESTHSLRHTYATQLLMASGGNLRAVQRLLGHSTSRTTERYTARWDGEAVTTAALLPDPRNVQ